jgi:hypothetical protein
MTLKNEIMATNDIFCGIYDLYCAVKLTGGVIITDKVYREIYQKVGGRILDDVKVNVMINVKRYKYEKPSA